MILWKFRFLNSVFLSVPAEKVSGSHHNNRGGGGYRGGGGRGRGGSRGHGHAADRNMQDRYDDDRVRNTAIAFTTLLSWPQLKYVETLSSK